MVEEYIIKGLVKRRAKLAGDIENTKDALKAHVEALEKLDAVILMFDPDYKIEGIKPKSFRALEDWAGRGEMTRIVMDTLRQATEPLTGRDLAMNMMELRGMDRGDTKLLRKMTKRIGGALRMAREKGLTKTTQGPGQFMLWEIVR
jgi:hypothetical protein